MLNYKYLVISLSWEKTFLGGGGWVVGWLDQLEIKPTQPRLSLSFGWAWQYFMPRTNILCSRILLYYRNRDVWRIYKTLAIISSTKLSSNMPHYRVWCGVCTRSGHLNIWSCRMHMKSNKQTRGPTDNNSKQWNFWHTCNTRMRLHVGAAAHHKNFQ